MFTALNDQIEALLGPMGLIIIVGVLGLCLVALTVTMMLRQPEDPLDKLKRSSTSRTTTDDKAKLRQADGNVQLQKFAKFLEPENVDELSAKQLELRQAGYQGRDAVRMFYFA
ncbi:MAG: type II secretion system F family protein, partial [Pseudomonadota bacterium]